MDERSNVVTLSVLGPIEPKMLDDSIGDLRLLDGLGIEEPRLLMRPKSYFSATDTSFVYSPVNLEAMWLLGLG